MIFSRKNPSNTHAPHLTTKKRVAEIRRQATIQKNKETKRAREIVNSLLPDYNETPIGGTNV